MDVFIEQLVVKKKDIKDLLYYSIIGLGNLLLIYLMISVSFFKYLIPLIVICLIYGNYFLIIKRNIEYEYIVTNGDLDIDIIISKKKRKRIVSTAIKEFEIISSIKSDKLTPEIQNIKNVIHTESSMEAEGLYFGVFSNKGRKTLLVLEPGEKVLNAIKAAAPRKVFVD